MHIDHLIYEKQGFEIPNNMKSGGKIQEQFMAPKSKDDFLLFYTILQVL